MLPQSHMWMLSRASGIVAIFGALLLAALDECGVGGGEAEGGLPLVGQPLKGGFTPKAHMSGVLNVVPCRERIFVAGAFCHYAKPAAGLKGAV